MPVVAVTGASGFVGRAICVQLAQAGHRVRAVTRNGTAVIGAHECVASGNLMEASLFPLVSGCDAVVHCAARVHVLRESASEAERAHRAMNADLPVRLAEAARTAGVRRFIQISSVAAVASSSAPREVINDATTPRPTSPYGQSKLAADRMLASFNDNAFSVVSLRPPAIYGPGVGAWFGILDRAARHGLPLPLGNVGNRRSFMYVGNVASAAVAAAERGPPGAYIVTDSAPISSADLYARLLRLHGYGRRVFPMNSAILQLAARLAIGKRAASLLGDAAFDGTNFANAFAWSPDIDLDHGLALTLGAPGL